MYSSLENKCVRAFNLQRQFNLQREHLDLRVLPACATRVCWCAAHVCCRRRLGSTSDESFFFGGCEQKGVCRTRTICTRKVAVNVGSSDEQRKGATMSRAVAVRRKAGRKQQAVQIPRLDGACRDHLKPW